MRVKKANFRNHVTLALLAIAWATLSAPAVAQEEGELPPEEVKNRCLEGGEWSEIAVLERCKQAETLFPDDPKIQNAIGLSHEMLEQYEEALAHYQRARDLAPDWRNPVYGLADVYAKMGRWDEAIALYEDGLRMVDEAAYEPMDLEIRDKKLPEAQRGREGFAETDEIIKWRQTRMVSVTRRLPLKFHFEKGSAEISRTAHEQIGDLIKAMKSPEWGSEPVRLIGHASPEGTKEFNEQLSERRVKAVKRYVEARVSGATITVEWKGETDPVKNADGSIDYEASRRVELAHAPARTKVERKE